MIVKEIMSENPVYVTENDFITHARQLIRDRYFRSLPVVDKQNRVIGILTDQDVLKIYSTRSNVTISGFVQEYPIITPETEITNAVRLMLKAEQEVLPVVKSLQDKTLIGIVSIVDIFKNLFIIKKAPSIKVGRIMTTDVITCSNKDPVSKVWLNMNQYGYSGIPVLSDKGELVGIITQRDVIKAGYARLKKEDERGLHSSGSPKVERIMSTPVHTVTPETSIKDAIELLLQFEIGRLIVVDKIHNNKMVGIIDRYDLIKVCI